MEIRTSADSFFIFDLDDTLYPEISFLNSAFREIARQLEPYLHWNICFQMLEKYRQGYNVFQWIVDNYKDRVPGLSIQGLVAVYRSHFPEISLDKATAGFLHVLQTLSIPAGLITDGRSLTQRNKLKALGISDYFTDIIISEEFGSAKPDERNYRYFCNKYPGRDFFFFGDNTAKDFIVPARLGWTSICLKDTGDHIHPQHPGKDPIPDIILSSFSEIRLR